MQEILFLSHRIPFPPDRGDKIRSHHILKRLARIAPVHVATFADDDSDMMEEVEIATLARSYKLVRRNTPLMIAGIKALVKGEAVSLSAFRNPAISDYVKSVLARHPIQTIYVFSGQMGQYVPEDFTGRVIADFVDVDSAKFEAYAAKKGALAGWIDGREARLLRIEEARLAARADVSLLISQAEADLFASRLSPQERENADIRVLGNGIDHEYFYPRSVEAEERMLAIPFPRLIFTGQMDYAPNVEAALRVCNRILPLIQQELPEASFHIVGRKPVPELMARDGIGGVHVWGRVDDIRCWLKAANLAIVPLEIARGVQNKVLEAMAMALPVVLTQGAATGIGARNGEHFSVAESDEDLAAAAITLLTDLKLAQSRGLTARRFINEKVTWPAALTSLPEILGSPNHIAAAARDAA